MDITISMGGKRRRDDDDEMEAGSGGLSKLAAALTGEGVRARPPSSTRPDSAAHEKQYDDVLKGMQSRVRQSTRRGKEIGGEMGDEIYRSGKLKNRLLSKIIRRNRGQRGRE